MNPKPYVIEWRVSWNGKGIWFSMGEYEASLDGCDSMLGILWAMKLVGKP